MMKMKMMPGMSKLVSVQIERISSRGYVQHSLFCRRSRKGENMYESYPHVCGGSHAAGEGDGEGEGEGLVAQAEVSTVWNSVMP